MSNNNPVLITGSSGFIGRHLVENLAGEGYRLICFDRRPFPTHQNPNKNTTYILGDLDDKESLERTVREANVCIHLASVINSKDETAFERVNIQGMSNIIEMSSKYNMTKFVYISSSDVVVNPDSLYGQSKARAEELLRSSSLDYTILRPTVVYGRYDDKNISSIIKTINNSPVVPILGDGEYTRQPLYIEDLIYTIKKCIQIELSNRKTYHVGGRSILTMNDIIQTILRVLNKKRLKVHLPLNMTKNLCLLFAPWSPQLRRHVQQFMSIEKDKFLNIKSTEEELDFKPTEFESGLRAMLGML